MLKPKHKMAFVNRNNRAIHLFNLRTFTRVLGRLYLLFLATTLLIACAVPTPQPPPPAIAKELVFYNWVNYMPQSVLDTFEQEYGAKIIYRTYETMEEGIENIATSQVHYDVAVIENDNLPALVKEKLLAQINYGNVPNIKNISPNFRDPAYDPGNRYSIPYNYGTTGLLVRTDLIKSPVNHWSDLWDAKYAGKIAMRTQKREWSGITLKALGYSINSEDPVQLQAALDRMLVLKKSVLIVDADPDTALKPLFNGDVLVLVGWNGDALIARQQNPAIQYIMPDEGTMVWGDSFVISANSANKYTAELFLNFLLRPEISAEIIKTYFYPSANDATVKLLPPEIANDPIIFSSPRFLSRSDFYQPLSPTGQMLYDEIWNQVWSK